MRTRIMALAVLASALATCLFAIPLADGVLQLLSGQERDHLVRVASDVAIDAADEVETGAPIDPTRSLTAAVFDMDGHRLAGTAPDRDVAIVEEALDGAVRPGTDGDLLIAAAPITHGDEVIGAVLVTEERTDVLGEVALVWAGMAGWPPRR